MNGWALVSVEHVGSVGNGTAGSMALLVRWRCWFDGTAGLPLAINSLGSDLGISSSDMPALKNKRAKSVCASSWPKLKVGDGKERGEGRSVGQTNLVLNFN